MSRSRFIVVAGYAAVFNSPATIREKSGRTFVETIRPGAFASALRSRAGIPLTLDHRTVALARTGDGCLDLVEDGHGLRFLCATPANAFGYETARRITNGEFQGASVEMAVGKDEWTRRDGVLHRAIITVSRLDDISISDRPAYPATRCLTVFNGEARSAENFDRRRRLAKALASI